MLALIQLARPIPRGMMKNGGHGQGRYLQPEVRYQSHFFVGNESATPSTSEDTLLPLDLPAVSCKKVITDLEGGLIRSDGGLVRLRAAERQLGRVEMLLGCMWEWNDRAAVVHTLSAM